ncbi:cryptochrome/photolyase family protein [Flagellimonas allohymeniacidonis]|uniref:Deoxyribodipyrimidine photo-lyase n=1 Tax=Flagellimonas allohymeniacidonis TaxID=2517819 RepID=A0A4Q8QDR6_9FLAO|nr:deoxyribodipyrimidine photo-lyase [Allomuricauda hymeniacidonis]TAI48622.1 deoxyribodipyrimidine photo-lyase [Allomuricauda hymeniacidonis]
MKEVAVFWFRRDLRLEDNVGFYHALKSGYPVLPIFIFDSNILEELPKDDPRLNFIHMQLQKMNLELKQDFQSGIAMFSGNPLGVFKELVPNYTVKAVFTNHDYEPYALMRDQEIGDFLNQQSIDFKSFKDQVIFEKNEVVKDDGKPYVVYTPYKNKWKEAFKPSVHLVNYDTYSSFGNLINETELPNLNLEDIGFTTSNIKVPDFVVTPNLIENYEATRNFPSKDKGTSRLGPHLRFGTVSIRQIVKKAIAEENEVFWSELIWREFFMQILWHFPHTVNKAFKPKYDRIAWRNNEKEFELWKNGKTGYALVDAGMRELNSTGYMHNRVRMLVASFLCKHLLIDWRWGEAYFAEKLLDYEQASNVGNWQWAAGSGVDAAPYFRIFNPMTQVDKFDKQKEYINQWVPELQELDYPQKMVDHKMARERCLKVYKEAVG